MSKTEIKVPMPGIFYRRPSPDSAPFKADGDAVAADDVVGLVEVMKNFHEIRSAGVRARRSASSSRTRMR